MRPIFYELLLTPSEDLEASPPDTVISDVMMPGMTGVELAIRLRKAQPDCRVLLFSGQAATADLLEKARSEGYDFDLLSKPVYPADLLTKLRVRMLRTEPNTCQTLGRLVLSDCNDCRIAYAALS
jgi:CheY-like chemotaxis protein